MGGLSIWHLLIVALLFVLLFGKGKISDLMGDVAKGVKNFKQGMADDDEPKAEDTAAPAPVLRVSAPAKKPVVRKTAAKKPAAKKAAPKVTLAIEHKPDAKVAARVPKKPRAKKS